MLFMHPDTTPHCLFIVSTTDMLAEDRVPAFLDGFSSTESSEFFVVKEPSDPKLRIRRNCIVVDLLVSKCLPEHSSGDGNGVGNSGDAYIGSFPETQNPRF